MIELRSRRSHRVSPSSIITSIFDAKVIDLRELPLAREWFWIAPKYWGGTAGPV
jgi:hypothetical protein